MKLLSSSNQENKSSLTKCVSGLTFPLTFIKAIALLSCAVLSFLHFDNGSNLLNTSYSTNNVQAKSQKTDRPQANNEESFTNRPVSLDSAFTNIKNATKKLSSSLPLVSNESIKEKATAIFVRSKSLREKSAKKENGFNNTIFSYPIRSYQSFNVNFTIENNNEVKSSLTNSVSFNAKNKVEEVNDQNPPKIIWLMSFPASGTTFTIDLVHEYSNMTIGKNVGHDRKNALDEQGYSIPVHPSK